TEGSHPQDNNLFRRPPGLADGLALKEPALLTDAPCDSPQHNLGPPVSDFGSKTRRSWRGTLAKCKDACSIWAFMCIVACKPAGYRCVLPSGDRLKPLHDTARRDLRRICAARVARSPVAVAL